MRTLLGLVVLGTASVLFAACGGDAGSATCQLQGEVSGAVSWKSGADDPSCLIPFSSSSGGVEMDYRLLQMSIQQFDVQVSSVKKEQTGAFPAQISVRAADGRTWSTTASACTVTVESNTFVMDQSLGKSYQMSGHGECKSSAMPAGSASGVVTIAPFTFRFPPVFF